jgi:hypothetical protein
VVANGKSYDGVFFSANSLGMYSVVTHIITGFVTRVTRRVSHVEQELLYLCGAHEFTPGFSEVRASSLIFSFLCNVLYFVVYPFLTIVLCPSSIDGF